MAMVNAKTRAQRAKSSILRRRGVPRTRASERGVGHVGSSRKISEFLCWEPSCKRAMIIIQAPARCSAARSCDRAATQISLCVSLTRSCTPHNPRIHLCVTSAPTGVTDYRAPWRGSNQQDVGPCSTTRRQRGAHVPAFKPTPSRVHILTSCVSARRLWAEPPPPQSDRRCRPRRRHRC